MFDTGFEERIEAPRSLLSLARGSKASAHAAEIRPAGPRDPRPGMLGAAVAEARRRSYAAAPAHAARQAPVVETDPAGAPQGGSYLQRLKGWKAAKASAPEPAPPPAEHREPEPLPIEPRAVAPASGDERYWRPIIDPFAVIGTIFGAKWLILACAVFGTLLGVVTALNTPKKYTAFAELLIDPRDLKLTERDLTVGGLPSDATLALVENQTRVLTSGSVLNKVVDRLKLADDPEFNGEAGGFGFKAAVAGFRAMLSAAGPGGDGAVRRRALAVEKLGESLAVERGGKTFVIGIAATTHEPEKSAVIANTMTEVFLETYGQIQSDTAGRAADELNGRLKELRAGVEAAERRSEEFKREKGIVDAQGKLITDEEILKLNDQLTIARARALELGGKANSARTLGVDDALSGALPEGVGSNVVTELRSQYAALKSQSDLLSVRLGPRHPQFLAVQAQLAGAREQLETELRRIVASIGIEQNRAAQLQTELSARLDELKIRQGALSDDLVTLRELEREATTKRSVYESYLLRARETGEQRGINTANMSVISTAYPPLEPVGPSRAVITLTGLLLGLVAGIGLAGGYGAVRSLRANTILRQPAPVFERPPSRAVSAAQPEAVTVPPARPFAAPPPEPEQPEEDELDALGASLRELHERVLEAARARRAAPPA